MEVPGTFISNREIIYTVLYPEDSGRLSARPTVNGRSALKLTTDPYYLTGYFQEPAVDFAKLTPEGL